MGKGEEEEAAAAACGYLRPCGQREVKVEYEQSKLVKKRRRSVVGNRRNSEEEEKRKKSEELEEERRTSREEERKRRILKAVERKRKMKSTLEERIRRKSGEEEERKKSEEEEEERKRKVELMLEERIFRRLEAGRQAQLGIHDSVLDRDQEEIVEAALEYYNNEKGTCFELVEVVNCSHPLEVVNCSPPLFFCDEYRHLSFTAKLPGSNTPKLYFAEVQYLENGEIGECFMVEVDFNSGRMYCQYCFEGYDILHPTSGFRVGCAYGEGSKGPRFPPTCAAFRRILGGKN